MNSLHYVRRGGGEPLMLIHPLGGELCVWDPVIDRVAAERDAIALDMPGFGASPPLPGGAEPAPQALARAVASFMDELGLADAHVAGCSLGGWVAIELGRLGRARSAASAEPARSPASAPRASGRARSARAPRRSGE